MTWQLLAILAAALWAAVNVLDKFTISRYVKNPLVMFSITGLVTGASAAVIYVLGLVKPIPWAIALWAMLAGALYILASILYFKAIKSGEISRIAPLFHVAPLFTALGAAFFLGEIFTSRTYLGIGALVAGAILLSPKGEGRYFKMAPAFWQMMLAALLVSLGNVAAKYALDLGGYWTSLFYIGVGEVIVIIPIFYLAYGDIASTLRQHGKRVLGFLSLIESLDLGAMLIYYSAISIGFVTLVNTLSSVQPFFVLLFAILLSYSYPRFLREEINKQIVVQKLVAIALMFIGVILIT